jgi:hypothetical protein
VPVSVLFGTAPITVSSFCPPLKIITVGIERMPYSVATEGLSSVFSLTCGGWKEWWGGGRSGQRTGERKEKVKKLSRPSGSGFRANDLSKS